MLKQQVCYISSATSGKPMYLRVGGSDRLTILSNGNVGIGLTNPGAINFT